MEARSVRLRPEEEPTWVKAPRLRYDLAPAAEGEKNEVGRAASLRALRSLGFQPAATGHPVHLPEQEHGEFQSHAFIRAPPGHVAHTLGQHRAQRSPPLPSALLPLATAAPVGPAPPPWPELFGVTGPRQGGEGIAARPPPHGTEWASTGPDPAGGALPWGSPLQFQRNPGYPPSSPSGVSETPELDDDLSCWRPDLPAKQVARQRVPSEEAQVTAQRQLPPPQPRQLPHVAQAPQAQQSSQAPQVPQVAQALQAPQACASDASRLNERAPDPPLRRKGAHRLDEPALPEPLPRRAEHARVESSGALPALNMGSPPKPPAISPERGRVKQESPVHQAQAQQSPSCLLPGVRGATVAALRPTAGPPSAAGAGDRFRQTRDVEISQLRGILQQNRRWG